MSQSFLLANPWWRIELVAMSRKQSWGIGWRLLGEEPTGHKIRPLRGCLLRDDHGDRRRARE